MRERAGGAPRRQSCISQTDDYHRADIFSFLSCNNAITKFDYYIDARAAIALGLLSSTIGCHLPLYISARPRCSQKPAGLPALSRGGPGALSRAQSILILPPTTNQRILFELTWMLHMESHFFAAVCFGPLIGLYRRQYQHLKVASGQIYSVRDFDQQRFGSICTCAAKRKHWHM